MTSPVGQGLKSCIHVAGVSNIFHSCQAYEQEKQEPCRVFQESRESNSDINSYSKNKLNREDTTNARLDDKKQVYVLFLGFKAIISIKYGSYDLILPALYLIILIIRGQIFGADS